MTAFYSQDVIEENVFEDNFVGDNNFHILRTVDAHPVPVEQ